MPKSNFFIDKVPKRVYIVVVRHFKEVANMTKATKDKTRDRVMKKFVISDDPKKSFITGYMIGVAEQAAKVAAEKEKANHKKTA